MNSLFQTKRRLGLGEEAARIANNILNRSSASPGPKKGAAKDKDEKKDKDAKKGVSYVPFSISFIYLPL